MNQKSKQKQEVSRSNCRRVGRRTPSNYKIQISESKVAHPLL